MGRCLYQLRAERARGAAEIACTEPIKLVMQMTLISIGLYNKPAGAWLSSILF